MTTPTQTVQKPVAFLYKNGGSIELLLRNDTHQARRLRNVYLYEETPLYAHPATPAPNLPPSPTIAIIEVSVGFLECRNVKGINIG